MSDMNLTLISGRVTTDPELKTLDSGTKLTRVLVTVGGSPSGRPRVDVIPVILWDDHLPLTRGDQVVVIGTLQRRYWEGPDGRRSRIQVTAETIRQITGDGIEDFDTVADLIADATAPFNDQIEGATL